MVLDMFVFIEASTVVLVSGMRHVSGAMLCPWKGLGAVATYIVFIMDYVPQAVAHVALRSCSIIAHHSQEVAMRLMLVARCAPCGGTTIGAQTSSM